MNVTIDQIAAALQAQAAELADVRQRYQTVAKRAERATKDAADARAECGRLRDALHNSGHKIAELDAALDATNKAHAATIEQARKEITHWRAVAYGLHAALTQGLKPAETPPIPESTATDGDPQHPTEIKA